MGGQPHDPGTDDDEIVTWWGLVIEGYLVTQERLVGEIAQRFGLSAATFDILIRLVRSPEQRKPITRLAHEAAFTSGGFTKLADRMVAADLIRREPCATDRRVTYIVLTDHGRQLAEQVRQAIAEILRRTVLAPLGPQRAAALAETMRTLRGANGAQSQLVPTEAGQS